jgi:hypothetical protein
LYDRGRHAWPRRDQGQLAADEYFVTDPKFYAEANGFDRAKIEAVAKSYPNKLQIARSASSDQLQRRLALVIAVGGAHHRSR